MHPHSLHPLMAAGLLIVILEFTVSAKMWPRWGPTSPPPGARKPFTLLVMTYIVLKLELGACGDASWPCPGR
jgi:hypothetical protein